VYVRAVNKLLVASERRGDPDEEQVDAQVELPFPKDGVVYRGGGLKEEHRLFYEEGKEFRVPGFLAASFEYETAYNFMCRADRRKEPCVAWEIHVDPDGKDKKWCRCAHVNYVESSNVKKEKEYLFAPYAPFKVKQVRPSPCPRIATRLLHHLGSSQRPFDAR